MITTPLLPAPRKVPPVILNKSDFSPASNSSLDPSGELGLANAVRHMKKLNSLVILVTHRKSIIPACDRVITLNDGNLISDQDIDAWKLDQKNIKK